MITKIINRYSKRHTIDLLSQLGVIVKHFRQAKRISDVQKKQNELTAVYNELKCFEDSSRNNVGFNDEVEKKMMSLYLKIDAEQAKYFNYDKELFMGDID